MILIMVKYSFFSLECNLEGLFEADESQPYSDEVKEFIKQLDRGLILNQK